MAAASIPTHQPPNKAQSWFTRKMTLKMKGWLDKRIPPADEFVLDMQNIFILPSRFGWLFLTLILALFLLGTNYQNNLMRILSYFLLALMLINLFISYINFSGLRFRLNKGTNAFVGETLTLTLAITSDKRRSHSHGLLTFAFWGEAESVYFDQDFRSTDISDSNTCNLSLTCAQRGLHKLPRLTISSTYPLGLYRCWTHLAFAQTRLVYPKPMISATQLVELTGEGEGESQQPIAGYEDFFSLKAYVPGEPLNHVAWKQLAKGQGMLSKEFSQPTTQSAWLTLLPCSPEHLETRLSQLTYQVLQLSQQQITFGLDLGHMQLPADSGLSHQQSCLAALATVHWQHTREPKSHG